MSLSRRPAGAPNDLTPSSISMSSPRMPRVGTEGTSGASERAEVLDQPFTTVLAPESPRPAYCNSAKLGPHRSAGVPLVQAPAQRYRFDMVATRVGGSVDPRRSLRTFDPQAIAHAPNLVVDPLRATRDAPEAHRYEAASRLAAHFISTIGGTRRESTRRRGRTRVCGA